ncbi:MAG: DUF45 domain-containing protein [Clostridia bacterium]|nr:DUF45 domain-containing protein [Clostridia bacterium]
MKQELFYNGNLLAYELEYKKVKNINLRIKADGSIFVSANKRVPKGVIETFVLSKAPYILKVQKDYASRNNKELTPCFSEEEIRKVILELCGKAFPYFENRGVLYPAIRFRKMVSRWGSCHTGKGILTFNTNLMYAPLACVEYVVFHEFTHFLQGNHSKLFYAELEKVCPNWKECRKKLAEIPLRQTVK